ncbi:hypothetical protein [Streptomyces griseoluteus]|uniref:hypothetical protein n=1 Tax=Streptomyces griseoluteus TaxID=29306 RepID=UPI003646C41B
MPNAAARARRQELLEAMRAEPRHWTTGQVTDLYVANGWGCNRSAARADLRALAADGHLIEHGPENERSYRLNAAQDTR